jgi:protein phosphatase 2C-like protein
MPMEFTAVSEPTPGRVNEDCVILGNTWAAVLDGATAPPSVDSGCVHDVRWLVNQLAGNLARILLNSPAAALTDVAAEAIASTCTAHESTCDLRNPDSPSSTMTIVRELDSRLDYLTLADSPLVVDLTGKVVSIADDRTAHLKDYSIAGVSAVRNTPEGFYVASTMPEAAYHSVHGSFEANEVRRLALLTDGASRLADYFRLVSWAELLDILEDFGPRELLNRTREVERSSEGPKDGRRRKMHDDATAVFISRAA